MKRTRILLIFAVLVLAALLTAGMCYADSVSPGDTIMPTEDGIYCVHLNADSEVTISTESGYINYYGSDSTCSALAQYYGPCEDKIFKYNTFNCKQGDNYFKFTGRSEVTFIWEPTEETNNTLENAEELQLALGEVRDLPLEDRTYYYTLNLTESGKYTFQAVRSAKISIWEGKSESSEDLIWDNDNYDPYTMVMPKGIYTIQIYTPGNGTGEAKITRENWIGISQITCNESYSGVLGKTVTFKVNYSPANADSQITIKEAKAFAMPEGKVKKVSQKDGVATFKIEMSQIYDKSKDKTSRQYEVSTEEGLSKVIEEKAGPKAAKIEKKAIGYVYGGEITISNNFANKFDIQLKSGGKWKTIMKNIKGAPGSSWVKIAFYDSTGKKLIKPGKEYTARIVSYADGVKGANKTFKFITAYNTKPTKLKATCISTKFKEGKGEYTKWDDTRGWITVFDPDKSIATVKVTYTKAKKSQATEVDGTIRKSGKKYTMTFDGKLKKAKTVKITVRSVRKKNGMVAYGPSVQVKCKIKKASK